MHAINVPYVLIVALKCSVVKNYTLLEAGFFPTIHFMWDGECINSSWVACLIMPQRNRGNIKYIFDDPTSNPFLIIFPFKTWQQTEFSVKLAHFNKQNCFVLHIFCIA